MRMTQRTNELDQPIGAVVPNWKPCSPLPRTQMVGRTCTVEPLVPERHAADLYAANSLDKQGSNWTYLGYGPFETLDEYRAWLDHDCAGDDPLFHAVIDNSTGLAIGIASFLRATPQVGVIEVGHINFSPLAQRTQAATEAMFLLMQRVFDELGYRRYEWKCDALNARSLAAAKRLGFRHEGTFRQATMYKGRNRDTAWFSIIDSEWPALREAFNQWLAPSNFDEQGLQRTSLSKLTKTVNT